MTPQGRESRVVPERWVIYRDDHGEIRARGSDLLNGPRFAEGVEVVPEAEYEAAVAERDEAYAERDRIVKDSRAWPRPSALQAAESRAERLREALRGAEEALRDARNGLDLGLGCARDIEGDNHPKPWGERSRRADAYLERARKAHKRVLRALDNPEEPK